MQARLALFVALSFGVAGACFLATSGCSSSSSSGPSSSDPFVGNWSCTSQSTTTYTQPPNTPATMGMGAYTVSITDDGQGNITVTKTGGDGGPECAIKSKLQADGKTRQILKGEICMLPDGNTQTFTMGTATVSGNTESGSSTWTITGMTKTGAMLAGMGTGTSSCTRM